VTTLEALRVFMYYYVNHEAKEIAYLGYATAQGYRVPHPGTVPHPHYAGSLKEPMAYYMLDDGLFHIYSCEALMWTEVYAEKLLATYKNSGYTMKKISEKMLKTHNEEYAMGER